LLSPFLLNLLFIIPYLLFFVVRYWMLDAPLCGISLRSTRYWMLDTRYWMLDARYWMLDVEAKRPDPDEHRGWMLEIPSFHFPTFLFPFFHHSNLPTFQFSSFPFPFFLFSVHSVFQFIQSSGGQY
jgi:hypothetical protein